MNNKNRKENINNFIDNKKIFIGGLAIFSVFVLSLCLILDSSNSSQHSSIE